MHIHVIHENAAWLEPLARALDAEHLPWRDWFLDSGVIDLSAPPPVLAAVALGWLFYREPFGAREAAAMSVIFVGVGLVKWQSGKAALARMEVEA